MEILVQGFWQALQLILRGDPELIQISGRSLAVSLLATLLSAAIGIPIGILLAATRFHGRAVLNVVVNTGMGLPPVVVGLVVSILLWRSGPFGALQLIYTPSAMVMAQLLVALPIVAGFTRAAIESIEEEQIDAFRVYGAAGLQLGRQLIQAAWPGVILAVTAGFGRAIAEVGASLMVGGNIAGQTRVLTTAITLATSRGEFPRAIALGLVLLGLAFLVNIAFHWATTRQGTLAREIGHQQFR